MEILIVIFGIFLIGLAISISSKKQERKLSRDSAQRNSDEWTKALDNGDYERAKLFEYRQPKPKNQTEDEELKKKINEHTDKMDSVYTGYTAFKSFGPRK